MKGYLGRLIQMTGITAAPAAGNVRNAVHNIYNTAPRPIHREETVTVQAPPSQSHTDSQTTSTPHEEIPVTAPPPGNHEPVHRDNSAPHSPQSPDEAPTLSHFPPTAPQDTQVTIPAKPVTQKTIPPLAPPFPPAAQDSPGSHKSYNSHSHMSHRAYMSSMSHPSYQSHKSDRSHTTADTTATVTPPPPETNETVQIRGQANNPSPPETIEAIQIRDQIRGQANNPSHPPGETSQPLPVESVPVEADAPLPQSPVITLEDIRQYVAASEPAPAPPQPEEPQSPSPIQIESTVPTIPGSMPNQTASQAPPPEPIETQQFSLSIGSINLTVEAPEPQTQSVYTPPPPPERRGSTTQTAGTAGTRWGRNYIRIK